MEISNEHEGVKSVGLKPSWEQMFDLDNFIKNLENSFNDIMPQRIDPDPIARDDGSTLFTTSGVQVLYPYLFNGKPFPGRPLSVAQPVIRTQFFDLVDEDTSTSFINYSLLALGTDGTQHEEAAQCFFSCFNDLCSEKKVTTIESDEYEFDWKGVAFNSIRRRLRIDDLQIAESVFAPNFTSIDGQNISFSELAFGLERLAIKTTRKDDKYYSAEFGGSDKSSFKLDKSKTCDSVKSATLLSMSGVLPQNKAHGYRLRKFLKRTAKELPKTDLDLFELIENSYKYWSIFFRPAKSLDETTTIVRREYERNVNRLVLEDINKVDDVNVSAEINQPIEDFAHQLKMTGISSALVDNAIDGRLGSHG